MKIQFRFLLLLLGLGWAGCQSRPQQFEFGAYSQAERHYEKKEYAKAIEKYQEYLRQNREGNMAVIATYYLAKSHEELGQQDEARALYEKITKESPSLIWAEFSQARLKELKEKSVV